MISNRLNIRASLLLLIAWGPPAIAQDQAATQNTSQPDSSASGFALFEDIETTENRSRNSTRTSRETRATTAAPEFTLVGTSRIGGQYSVILQHRSGENVVIKATTNRAVQIPEHTNYSVQNIGAGSVSLRYPGGVPCEPFLEQGVSCDSATGMATLELANGAPLASARTELTVTDEAAEGESLVSEDSNAPSIPFEAIREARANGNPAAQQSDPRQNRFSPRRIAPEDVPPGQRVVSTPFGDRLVDQ